MKNYICLFIFMLTCISGHAQNYSQPSGAGNSGTDNTSLGTSAGQSGSYNTAVGKQAGNVVTGSNNSFFGKDAGLLTGSGGNNTFLGYQAGRSNVSGSGNVFIGKEAGYSETGSDKLYIDNSNTSTPLIFGNFSLNQVGINSLPNTTHTLTVGGSLYSNGAIYTTGLYVGGGLVKAWTASGANINYVAGAVSIGTTTAPTGFKLAVGGKAIVEEIVVMLQGTWPDYVFEKDYQLPSLEELQLYIAKHKHLPGVPSAKEVKENGVSIGEMNAILLQKIEELTLHVINLKNEVDVLKANQK